jgi:hypothetical protein
MHEWILYSADICSPMCFDLFHLCAHCRYEEKPEAGRKDHREITSRASWVLCQVLSGFSLPLSHWIVKKMCKYITWDYKRHYNICDEFVTSASHDINKNKNNDNQWESVKSTWLATLPVWEDEASAGADFVMLYHAVYTNKCSCMKVQFFVLVFYSWSGDSPIVIIMWTFHGPSK